MNNLFLTLFQPVWRTIDSGDFFKKPFGGVYILMAIGNIFLPFYLLYMAIDGDVFDLKAKYVIIFYWNGLFC